MPFFAVYLVKDGKVTPVVKDPAGTSPNGIALSTDEKELFVGAAGKIYRYDIQPDDTLTNERLFIDSSTDGMKVDQAGNVYTTTGGNVNIFGPDGKKLGAIQLPKILGVSATNVAFGDPDNKGPLHHRADPCVPDPAADAGPSSGTEIAKTRRLLRGSRRRQPGTHSGAIELAALEVDLRDAPGIRDVVERVRIEHDEAGLFSRRQRPQILQAPYTRPAGWSPRRCLAPASSRPGPSPPARGARRTRTGCPECRCRRPASGVPPRR